MKKYQYICTFLSDVVLSSKAATTGFNASLDYLSGAKFLGIAAGKLYDEKREERTLDLFHNGKVRFGDGHPYHKGKRAEKVPLMWYYPKGKSITNKVYLHQNMHLLGKEEWATSQPKQARTGYFTEEGKLLNFGQDFSLKSAYDRDTLKSKDQQMYGYFSLPKGSTWAFTVEDETGKYAEQLSEILEGKHGIGRSRSAEYGLVEIKFDRELPVSEKEEKYTDEILIYAASNLCFYDKYGRTTAQPDSTVLNLPKDSKIIWENSQIRSRVYQTWNRKRFNRDEDRLIIEKGSVIAVKLADSISSKVFENGIGAFRSEGFGKVIINPSFLQSTTAVLDLKLSKINMTENLISTSIVEVGGNDETVLAFLKSKENKIQKVFKIDELVNGFIKSRYSIYEGLSNSQWGMLRNYAKHAANIQTFKKLVFSEDFGCLNRGKSEKDWRKKGRRDNLSEYLFDKNNLSKNMIIPFTIKLASQMSKQKSSQA